MAQHDSFPSHIVDDSLDLSKSGIVFAIIFGNALVNLLCQVIGHLERYVIKLSPLNLERLTQISGLLHV